LTRILRAGATAVALSVAACSGHHSARSVGPTANEGAATTTTEAAATTTTEAVGTTAPERGPPFAVGTITHDFVDVSRGRTLHTIIHFPATGQRSFPLVLMAHGYMLPAGGYERILGAVAAAGYIVAAPAFPHTSAERGDGNRADIVNQPGDLSFLVGAVTDLSRSQPEMLPAVADPTRVAAIGHSDGGLTVSALAYNDRYRDRRVAAAVVIAGGIARFPGTYFADTTDWPPLLAIHATADRTNPYSASVRLFDAPPPGVLRFLLTVIGGSHLGPYMFETALPEVGRVIVDFLDGYFRDEAPARARLLVDGNHPGVVTLRSS